jgi:hypothetical protein
MSVNFAYKYLYHTPQGSLVCRKMLTCGADGFTSTPKKVVLRIFIILKNPSTPTGLEPAKLVSNGKQDNIYTADKITDVPVNAKMTQTSRI